MTDYSEHLILARKALMTYEAAMLNEMTEKAAEAARLAMYHIAAILVGHDR